MKSDTFLFFDSQDEYIKTLISLGYTKESALKSIKNPPKCDYPFNRNKVNMERDVKKDKELLEDSKVVRKYIKKIGKSEKGRDFIEALTNILEIQNNSIPQINTQNS